MSTLFVDLNSVGSNDGSSWDAAYQSLSTALSNAETGDEIWVAKGVYLPGTNRSDSFEINAGVTIYGGFDGTEDSLSDRDWQTNRTILSGDIGVADDESDNSYQVVFSDTNETAELNGMIIQGGNTEGSNGSDDGGGIYNKQSLTIKNTIVRDNRSIDDGGGIRNDGELLIINSAIADNSAAGANTSNSAINTSGGGGLINTINATATILNTTFSGNQALNGGAIRNDGELSLINTTVSGNTGEQSAGGILNTIDILTRNAASITLINSTVAQNSALLNSGIHNFGDIAMANSIVADNHRDSDFNNDNLFGSVTSRSDGFNLIGNGSSATGFVNAVDNDQVGTSTNPIDPLLGDLADNGGFTQTHLPAENSPVINKGSNSLLPADSNDLDGDGDLTEAITTDQRGFGRVSNDLVDIGAVEAVAVLPPADGNEPPSVTIEPILTSLSESVDTSQAIKLADVIVTDADEVGVNILSIISRYAELFEAANAEIIRVLPSVALEVFDLTTLATLDGELFEAIAAQFVETAGDNFSDKVSTELFNRVEDASETITLDSLMDLATDFLNTVDVDLFEETIDRFIETIDTETFSERDIDFLERLSREDFDAIATGFVEKIDTDFFESLVTDFLQTSSSDTFESLDSASIQAAISEFLRATDPDIFEVIEGELFLKAGTALDFETQSQYNITLQVDDTTVGSTPDAAASFRLQISDVNDNEVGVLELTSSQLLNLFTKTGAGGQLRVSIDAANAPQLSEVVVVSTDETGRINGIGPSEEGYLDALIAESLSLLSTLERNTFEGLDVTRQLGFDDGFLQFGVITGGTLDSLRRGGAGNFQIGPSVVDALAGTSSGILKAQPLGDGKVKLGFDVNGDLDFEDLVLTAELQANNEVLGAGLQGGGESELIDLRSVSGNITADVMVYREAAFDNVLGFFTVENAEGQVRDQAGNLLSVGDEGYIRAAIENQVISDLTGNNGTVETYSAQIAGNQLLSSFIVSNGIVADLLDDNAMNDPEVYFTHLGANSDGADHVRLLGDNTFGFEDTINGGDQDFDDLVVKLTFSVNNAVGA
ncbi:MAG: choice-of-anchor Q domain-containing protein [Cyanobacteria bacterium P01_D01_bin.1]